MADGLTAKFDVSDLLRVFTKMETKAVSLASRMAVSGGQVLRDEARIRAQESFAQASWPYNPISRGSHAAGTLGATDAIYLAKSDNLTTATTITYSISWNAKKAWWGKLKEFGWWQTHKIRYEPKGDYFVTTNIELPAPIRHKAHPFLAPAYEAKLGAAKEAMIARGRVELPILLGEPE